MRTRTLYGKNSVGADTFDDAIKELRPNDVVQVYTRNHMDFVVGHFQKFANDIFTIASHAGNSGWRGDFRYIDAKLEDLARFTTYSQEVRDVIKEIKHNDVVQVRYYDTSPLIVVGHFQELDTKRIVLDSHAEYEQKGVPYEAPKDNRRIIIPLSNIETFTTFPEEGRIDNNVPGPDEV